jgi:hypothetical protein
MARPNFHAAEASIVTALQERLQAGADKWARLIGTRKDLAAVAEEMQAAPAVYVVYDGFAVLDASPFEAVMAHRWLVVVAVKTAAQTRESAPLNVEAGPYVWDVVDALHGFVPEGAVKALVPATPPRPYYSDAGFAYFPVAFSCEARHTIRQGVLQGRPGRI